MSPRSRTSSAFASFGTVVVWRLTFDMSGGDSRRSLLLHVRSMEGLGTT